MSDGGIGKGDVFYINYSVDHFRDENASPIQKKPSFGLWDAARITVEINAGVPEEFPVGCGEIVWITG